MNTVTRFVRDVAAALSDPLVVFPTAGTVLTVALAVIAACQFAAAWRVGQ